MSEPQYREHADWCDLTEARYVPYWAQSSFDRCTCGADEHNAYVEGYREGQRDA